MKRFFYIIGALLVAHSSAYSTSYTIANSGNTFTPAIINIIEGDDINFVLSSAHNAVEVDQTTYLNGGNTPLVGGFSVPYGGGTVSASALPIGTHYYVCTPHAGVGMLGAITVNSPTTTNIHISAVNVVTEECSAKIQWKVEDESEVDYYMIEVSTDGEHFSDGEKVLVNEENQGSYSHRIEASAGPLYTTLKAINSNGSMYRATVLTDVQCDLDKKITLNFDASAGSYTIENTHPGDIVTTHDMLGRKISAVEVDDNLTVQSADQMMHGIYVITVSRLGSNIFSQRIQVAK